jgi:hypothetical protein
MTDFGRDARLGGCSAGLAPSNLGFVSCATIMANGHWAASSSRCSDSGSVHTPVVRFRRPRMLEPVGGVAGLLTQV